MPRLSCSHCRAAPLRCPLGGLLWGSSFGYRRSGHGAPPLDHGRYCESRFQGAVCGRVAAGVSVACVCTVSGPGLHRDTGPKVPPRDPGAGADRFSCDLRGYRPACLPRRETYRKPTQSVDTRAASGPFRPVRDLGLVFPRVVHASPERREGCSSVWSQRGSQRSARQSYALRVCHVRCSRGSKRALASCSQVAAGGDVGC